MSNYNKTPTVFQMESTECGAASLSMIFAYYGKNVPLEQMRIETGVSRDGCNAGNLMRCAKKYGLKCHGYFEELSGLLKTKTPCIIHWDLNHFVVFEGVKGKSAYINDPAYGRRKLTLEELDEGFSGVVLTFEKTADFTKEKKKSTLFSFIFSGLRGQYPVIAKLLFAGLLLVFPGVALPFLSQVFIDDILVGGNTSGFFRFLLFAAAAVVLQTVLTVYRNTVLARFQKKTVLLSAREFLYKLLRLPVSFFDQRYVGDLASRVGSNSNVSSFLSGELAETALNIFTALFYLVILTVYAPVLTGVALIFAAAELAVVKITSDNLSNESIKLQQDFGKLTGAVCAGLSITDTIKASGAENEYICRILGHSAKAVSTEQRLSKMQSVINALPNAVKMAGDVLILIIGAIFIINGDMTVGTLVAFTSLFGSFSQPLNALLGFVNNIQTTKADINRVEDIMNYPIDEKYSDAQKKRKITAKLEGSVELKNIAFGYSGLEPPVVADFSFKIKCGSSIALVGPSGCGKSTVSRIVSGLYKPWQGEYLLDGVPADEIPIQVLSASVSTVSRNITLFSGTVRDNLTMWNSGISEADMIAAAKDACIHDVISQKPGAYGYVLSEGGANFSVGQRQRLEIARALATNPTVLVMDEATSALDPLVEKQIMDNIKRRGCTCVVAAHRLSAIRDCDRIIVMDKGRIVERGTHDELIAAGGYYKRLVSSQ